MSFVLKCFTNKSLCCELLHNWISNNIIFVVVFVPSVHCYLENLVNNKKVFQIKVNRICYIHVKQIKIFEIYEVIAQLSRPEHEKDNSVRCFNIFQYILLHLLHLFINNSILYKKKIPQNTLKQLLSTELHC